MTIALRDSITVPAPGDDHCILRNFTDVTAGVSITKAWLTIKRFASDPDPGLVQKAVTTGDVPGVGHIVADGSTGTVTLRFDLSPTDTLLVATRQKFFDIQVLTTAGKIHTMNSGIIRAQKAQITETIT